MAGSGIDMEQHDDLRRDPFESRGGLKPKNMGEFILDISPSCLFSSGNLF
jgi:hypothetical protein